MGFLTILYFSNVPNSQKEARNSQFVESAKTFRSLQQIHELEISWKRDSLTIQYGSMEKRITFDKQYSAV
jgi:hypothetical protein